MMTAKDQAKIENQRNGSPIERTIHYSELPDAPNSPLCREWRTYRREAARLLAEGHEGRHVLIRNDEIAGIWDSHDEAVKAGYERFFGESFLVHQIQERERVLRCMRMLVPSLRSHLLYFLAIVFSLFIVTNFSVKAIAGPGESQTDRISALIRMLGNPSYPKREEAGNLLMAIGEPAIALLNKAAASNADLEIRKRASRLIDRIHEGLNKKELDKIQGEWILESGEIHGRKADEIAREKITISKDIWKSCIDEDECEFLMTVDASRPFKVIEFRLVKLKTSRRPESFCWFKRSIYKIENDRLILGEYENPREHVPDSFASSHVRFVLRKKSKER